MPIFSFRVSHSGRGMGGIPPILWFFWKPPIKTDAPHGGCPSPLKNEAPHLKKQALMWWEINSTQYISTLDVMKRRSKVQEKNMSCKHALNFDHRKTFSENYKSVRVWLWLAYKFTKNYCCLWLLSKFIQTQMRYPTSIDKILILTWKLLVISS